MIPADYGGHAILTLVFSIGVHASPTCGTTAALRGEGLEGLYILLRQK